MSLLLSLASAVLWLRCYLPPTRNPAWRWHTYTEALYWGRTDSSGGKVDRSWRVLRSTHGLIEFENEQVAWPDGMPPNLSTTSTSAPADDLSWQYGRGDMAPFHDQVLGFRFVRDHNQTPRGGRRYIRDVFQIGVPYWLLCPLTAALPLWRSLNWRQARARKRPNRCPECGYDLRATPTRCPECGTVSEKVE